MTPPSEGMGHRASVETYQYMLDARLDRFGELLERTKGESQ